MFVLVQFQVSLDSYEAIKRNVKDTAAATRLKTINKNLHLLGTHSAYLEHPPQNHEYNNGSVRECEGNKGMLGLRSTSSQRGFYAKPWLDTWETIQSSLDAGTQREVDDEER